MHLKSTTLLLVAVLTGWATVAPGNGYKILCVKGAKATAMGEAFIAQADDPSAVAFNPAGLSQLRGNQANFQATFCNAYTEHEAPSGKTTDAADGWQLVPAFFAASGLGREGMGLGFGVSFPNGLSSEWADDSFARYVSTFSDLVVADIGPAFGRRFGDKLMVGAGLDFYYSEARLESMVDLGLAAGAPGSMDAESRLEGDGSTWGFNAGAIYALNERHRVAATYRHPFEIEYDGDVSLLSTRNDITATVDFPAVVVLGYAFRPDKRWTLEFDLDWTYWNGVDDITVDFKTPGVADGVLEEDLANTLACKFGVQYALSERLDLRAGYIYNENATPDRTFRPSLPDTDTHFVTAGFGYDVGSLTLDGALQLVFYETRTVDNNVDQNEVRSSSSVDGTYRTFAPCVSLAATYHF
jgi:long-chain fatty acid transport protein